MSVALTVRGEQAASLSPLSLQSGIGAEERDEADQRHEGVIAGGLKFSDDSMQTISLKAVQRGEACCGERLDTRANQLART